MQDGQIVAMVLQTVGMVAAFFGWIRKIEKDMRSEMKTAIEAAVKDQVRLFEKMDAVTEAINEIKVDTMRQMHSISQTLLRLTDKVDFQLGKKDD